MRIQIKLLPHIKKHYPVYLNLILAVVSLWMLLKIEVTREIWANLCDPYDYLEQSKKPLDSQDFWVPEKKDMFYPRPFTVPLFYRIAGSLPENIIVMQKIMHYLAVFLIFAAISLFIRKKGIQLILLFSWYFLMSWWNIMGWTNSILSESLGISMFFIWLASFLYLFQKKKTIYFVLHILCTILFSFTRDSWPYFLILFYLSVLLVVWFFHKKEQRIYYYVSLVLFAIIIFFIQQKTAQIGNRYRIPVMNNIVFRILPSEEKTQWFVDHGMPDAELINEKYGNLANWKDIFPMYDDTTITRFNNWVIEDGKSIYFKYLITHPKNFFLWNEKKSDLAKIMAYDFGYINPPESFSIYGSMVFPFFKVYGLIFLLAISTYLYFRKRKFILIFPLVLSLLFLANVVLLYLADSLETERHQYMTIMIVQFIGIFSSVLILDQIPYKKIFAKGILLFKTKK